MSVRPLMSLRPLGSIASKLRLRQLALIVAVADAGSLRAGAAQAHVSQPAATKMIHELEALFGTALFERGHAGMRPSEFGNAVVGYARDMLARLAQLHEELDARSKGQLGTVRVGALSASVPSPLTPAIAYLHRRHPGIQVSVEIDTNAALVERLVDGRLDFVLARMVEGCDPRQIAFQHLFDERLVVVAQPRYRQRGVRRLPIARLQKKAWALHPSGTSLRKAFEDAFRRASLDPPSAAIETTSAVVILSLLQQQDILALLPLRVAALFESHRMLTIVPAELPIDLGPIGMLTCRGHILRKPAALLAASLTRRPKQL